MNQKENENKNEQNMVKSHEEVRKKRIWIIVAIVVLVLCFVLEKVVILILDDYFWEEPKEHVDVADSNMQNKEEKLKQDALTYLEERYDEEFVVIYERGTSSTYNYIQLYAYPVAQQDEMHEIKIQGYYDDSRNIKFYDDYVMVRLTEEYEEYINLIIDEYFDEYKFYVDFYGDWLIQNLPVDIKLNDLWQLEANVDYPLPNLYIYLSPNEKCDINCIESVCAELQEKGIRGRVCIWILQEIERYNQLYRNDWGDHYTYKDYDDTVTVFIYDEKVEIMED